MEVSANILKIQWAVLELAELHTHTHTHKYTHFTLNTFKMISEQGEILFKNLPVHEIIYCQV